MILKRFFAVTACFALGALGLSGCSKPPEDTDCYVGPLSHFGEASSIKNAGLNILKYGKKVSPKVLNTSAYTGLTDAANEVKVILGEQRGYEKPLSRSVVLPSDIVKFCIHYLDSNDPNAGGRFWTNESEGVDLSDVKAVNDLSHSPKRFKKLPEYEVYRETFGGNELGTVTIKE